MSRLKAFGPDLISTLCSSSYSHKSTQNMNHNGKQEQKTRDIQYAIWLANGFGLPLYPAEIIRIKISTLEKMSLDCGMMKLSIGVYNHTHADSNTLRVHFSEVLSVL